MEQAAKFLAHLQVQLEHSLPFLPGAGDPELREIRKRALLKASEINFPTSKQATWKYTKFDNIINTSPNIYRQKMPISHLQEHLQFPIKEAYYFVFVNGFFIEEASQIPHNATIGLTNFETLSEKHDPMLIGLLSKSEQSTHLFRQLNTALVNDGGLLIIPENYNDNKPIFIQHYLIDDSNHQYLISPQLHIYVGKQATVDIIEQTFCLSKNKSFINAQTFITLHPFSHCRFIRSDQGHAQSSTFTYLSATQQVNSTLDLHALTYGGQYHRMEIQHDIADKETHFFLNGLSLSNKDTHHDWVTTLSHIKPQGQSNQLIKSVIENEGHASFLGNITVNPNANKTYANMENYHLLLGMKGKADSSPQLEIFCDDLKCNHRSNTTQLNDEPLFYLRSRGIPQKEATFLLLQAYVDYFTASIEIKDLRTYFQNNVMKLLIDLGNTNEN